MLQPDALAGRTALVTGSNRGIGLAVARGLLALGAEVWLSGRNGEKLAAAAAGLGEGPSGKLRPVVLDVADPASIKAAFAEINRTSKGLDILVNNAGMLRASAIEMASVDLIDSTFQANVRGLLVCSQYAARLMNRRGGGSIINLTSIMGRVGYPGQAVYSASKAAVIGATLSLAKELASRRIRVNAVAPGAIDTAMIGGLGADQKAQTIASIGMGRLGEPEDVANLCAFLASDAAAYITGQIIGVDGGMVV